MTNTLFTRKSLWAWLALTAILAVFYSGLISVRPYEQRTSYEQLYPVKPANLSFLTTWKQQLSAFSQYDTNQTQRLIQDSGFHYHVNPNPTQFLRLGAWLSHTLKHNPRREPALELAQQEFFDQFQLAAADTKQALWCGNFAIFGLLFYQSAGFTSRYIGLNDNSDQHVWIETYLPELNQWVLSDYMFNILALRNSKGKWLNAADYLRYHVLEQNEQLEMLQSTGSGTWEWVPLNKSLHQMYLDQEPRLLYYHTLNKPNAYHPLQKIKRYLYPSAWFDTYTLHPRSNSGYFVRLFVLYAWLLLSLLLLTRWIYDRIKKH